MYTASYCLISYRQREKITSVDKNYLASSYISIEKEEKEIFEKLMNLYGESVPV